VFRRKPAITAQEASVAVASRALVLIDVRQPAELRHGHVRGSVNIPLTELRHRLHELDAQRKVAFLCHSGARSSRATAIAIKAGYDAVNVRGGVIAWNRAGRPVTREER
jgi:rhodanese-related sulfurtransferase